MRSVKMQGLTESDLALLRYHEKGEYAHEMRHERDEAVAAAKAAIMPS